MCCRCIYTTSSLIPLSHLKEATPIETTEYTVSRDLLKEPTFALMVPHILHKRDRIVGLVKTLIQKWCHKYDMHVPANVKDSLRLDK